jgi:hypothetical protein
MKFRHYQLQLVAFVLAFSCKSHTPTPAQTELFALELQTPEGESAELTLDVSLGTESPTKLLFAVTTVTAPSGGRFITALKGTVSDGGGWAVSQTIKGNELNKGTSAVPLMALPVVIQRDRVTGCAEQTRTHIVEVRADGTLSIE